MSKIIYKDENITIKEISDRKIQVEKIVPVYVGEYLAEHIKMKIKFNSAYRSYLNTDETKLVYERMDLKTPEKVSLSVKYGAKLGNIIYVNRPLYSPVENIPLEKDISHIQINDKHLERALKLKMVLE
jgi:hypothetical protein